MYFDFCSTVFFVQSTQSVALHMLHQKDNEHVLYIKLELYGFLPGMNPLYSLGNEHQFEQNA